MSYGVFDELKSCAPKFRFELNRDHRKRMKLKHDGASWSIMIIYDVSARRRCCAEAQARGVRGGGSPPGKMVASPNTTHMHETPAAAEAREQVPRHPLMGKHLHPARAEISPLAFFSLHLVHPFLPGDAGRPRRGNNNNTTTRWRVSWVPCHPSRPGSFR